MGDEARPDFLQVFSQDSDLVRVFPGGAPLHEASRCSLEAIPFENPLLEWCLLLEKNMQAVPGCHRAFHAHLARKRGLILVGGTRVFGSHNNKNEFSSIQEGWQPSAPDMGTGRQSCCCNPKAQQAMTKVSICGRLAAQLPCKLSAWVCSCGHRRAYGGTHPIHARCCMWLCNFWPGGSTGTVAGLQQRLDSQANASVWTQACPFKTPLCPRIYNYGRRMVVKLGTMLLSGSVGAAERS